MDEAFLARLARDREIVVSLIYPGGELSTVRLKPDTTSDVRLKPDTTSEVRLKPDTTYPATVGELQVPLIRTESDAPLHVGEARLQLTQPLTPLRALLRSADSWFLFTAAGTGITALLLTVWVSSRISRPLADLEVLEVPTLKLPQGVHLSVTKSEDTTSEINLLGCTVDEATSRADKFLDEAFLAQLPQVRIVHGMGTGALRNAITDLLKSHPHVTSFEFAPQNQGGRGVTIATLRD